MIRIENACFGWRKGEELIRIPRLEVPRGEKVLIRGRSGCGKTTLLTLLAGIRRIDRGSLRIRGQELKELSSRGRDRFRGDHMGYIFQQFNLIPWLSVEENIRAPLLFSPVKRAKEKGRSEERTREMLAALSLEETAHKKARDLSIGQQQRVAVARALVGGPELILADEPASALDPATKEEFLRLLFRECGKRETTLLLVSHDALLKEGFDREIPFEELNGGGHA